MASSNVSVSVPILTSSNFNNWKFRIRALLEKEQILNVIDEDKPTEDASKKKEFLIHDAKAKALIIQGVADKHLDLIKDEKTAKGMIEALQKVFVRASSFSKLTLWRRLISLKCIKRDSLEDHFLKFDTITRELEELGSKIDESDRISHLLLSLPKEYDTVVTALETQPNLKLDFVKARLLDEETKMKTSKPSTSHSTDNEVSFNSESPHFKRGGFANGRWRSNFRPNYRGRFQRSRRPYRGGNTHYSNKPNERANIGQLNEDISTFLALKEDEVTVNTGSHRPSNENIFVLDSGASSHLVKQELEPHMTNIKLLSHNINIHVANGQVMTTNKVGTLNVFCQNRKVTIEALIVPNLNHNLLAISKLTEKGYRIVIDKDKMLILQKNSKFYCTCDKGLYILEFEPDSILKTDKCFVTKTDENLWHRRLGHLNRKSLKMLNLPYSSDVCSSCIEGKATRLPFKRNHNKSTHIGQLIHSDVCGPFNPETHDGYKYFQVIIDDYSHFTIVNLLKYKSEAEENLISYVKEVETQHGVKVQRIRVDNGGEVTSKSFKEFAREKGIRLQYTLPYSPQSNGKSERMNRTLLNMVRTKIAETFVPKFLWGEAIRCSAYELNRCPSAVLENGITPSALWYGRQDLSKLRVFGSRVWYTCIPKGSKLDPRAKTGVMIGYCGGGYRLWNPEERRVIVSRDVVFNENEMYFKPNEIALQDPEDNEKEAEERSPTKHLQENIQPLMNDDRGQEEEVEETRRTSPRPTKSPNKPNQSKRPIRDKRTPPYLQDYDVYNTYCLLTTVQPKSFDEAARSEDWKKAIDVELKSHEELNTFQPAVLPSGEKAIDLKWVFCIKGDGTKKARLVAKGFQQPMMFDEQTYAPVCRTSTLRIMLSQAVNQNWPLKQIDVPSAFLNGSLKEDVYVKRPEGVEGDSEILKLNRALYGLRVSPKCWNDTINNTLEKFGLTRSKYDFCLYSAKGVYLLLFVDYALITGDSDKIDSLISYLHQEYKVKDLGDAKCFLGMEIQRTESCIKVNQTKIIDKLLKDHGLNECRPVATPLEKGFQLSEDEMNYEVPYRSLVCSLMYIAVTARPDISYAVSVLSRVLDKPTNLCWKAAKRVLRYLSGSRTIGLNFYKGDEKLQGYSDADWGGDVESRKSTSGFIAFYGGNPVSWLSKKQSCVALSTMEAEYYAASTGAQDLVNLMGIVSVFSESDNTKACLNVDNVSAVSLVKTFQNSKRGKHIDIRAHFIKDLCLKGIIDIQHVSTHDNLADMFTKSLSKERFVQLRNAVMNC